MKQSAEVDRQLLEGRSKDVVKGKKSGVFSVLLDEQGEKKSLFKHKLFLLAKTW